MADIGDRAGPIVEAWTERCLSACAAQYHESETCIDCRDDLQPHRVQYGRCIDCAKAIELKARGYVR